jgi:carbon storage regulator
MLVLSRKTNENIIIDGRIVVKVIRTEGNLVKIGIEAPPEIPVHRQEIYEEIQRSNQGALRIGRPDGPSRFGKREGVNGGSIPTDG